MPGKNVFAFTGSAFVPTDRAQTNIIRARPNATTFNGVKSVKDLGANTEAWNATPPTASSVASQRFRRGSFPNFSTEHDVTWTNTSPYSLTTVFDIYQSVNSGNFTLLQSNITPASGGNTNTYVHTGIAADTNYRYLVRSRSTVSSLSTDSGATAGLSIASPSVVTTVSEDSKAWNSITWKWTYPANTYQRFHIYNTSGVYQGEVLPAASATSSTWTYSGLSENTSYGVRVYGQNYNGHWSGYRETTATTPYRCDCTGIIANATTTTANVGCGTCGTMTTYKRDVCGDIVCNGSCTESACGCVANVAERAGQTGNNGWTRTDNFYTRSQGCGTCGIQYDYADKWSKSGCTDYQAGWEGYGTCFDTGDCTSYGVSPCDAAPWSDVTDTEYSHWNRVSFVGLTWSYVDFSAYESGVKGLCYFNSGGVRYEHFSECCNAGTIYGCNTNCGAKCCYCFPKIYRIFKCSRTGKISLVFWRCINICSIFGCT